MKLSALSVRFKTVASFMLSPHSEELTYYVYSMNQGCGTYDNRKGRFRLSKHDRHRWWEFVFPETTFKPKVIFKTEWRII